MDIKYDKSHESVPSFVEKRETCTHTYTQSGARNDPKTFNSLRFVGKSEEENDEQGEEEDDGTHFDACQQNFSAMHHHHHHHLLLSQLESI